MLLLSIGFLGERMKMRMMSLVAAAAMLLALGACATGPAGDGKEAEVYSAPEPALGSNLARRGEKRNANGGKEISGDAMDALRDSVKPPVSTGPKGVGG
ncbi:MAG: hypothetical protein HY021_09810 [Burkholderiales bacterium]|nr:hypothetical protein [Burkholderiales bacterium]